MPGKIKRYTHRVAISNNGLLEIPEDKVTFRYKDYRHDAQQKTILLDLILTIADLVTRRCKRVGGLLYFGIVREVSWDEPMQKRS
jgi:hypothetical protein